MKRFGDPNKRNSIIIWALIKDLCLDSVIYQCLFGEYYSFIKYNQSSTTGNPYDLDDSDKLLILFVIIRVEKFRISMKFKVVYQDHNLLVCMDLRHFETDTCT